MLSDDMVIILIIIGTDHNWDHIFLIIAGAIYNVLQNIYHVVISHLLLPINNMRDSILICFLLLVQLAYIARSARRVDANARARETLQRRREIAVKAKRGLEEDVFTKEELFQLTPGEKLEEVVESRDALGNTVERLQESYNGVPVLDGVVTVKKSQEGQLTGDASGTLIQEIDDDLAGLKEEITADEAIDIAINAESDDRNSIGDIKVKKVIILDDQDVAKMVYRVTYLIDGIKRPVSFVDSRTGRVLRRYNSLNTYPCKNKMYNAIGGNLKMGKIEYGRVPYCLDPTRKGDTCYLENNFVRVVDMRNDTFENITDTASFPCHKGYADKINGAFSPAVDAFYFGTLVGKMFEEWFKRQPLKEKMVLRVHYDEMMENAFWNGENSTFGDGNSTFYPLVTMDIVAHEVGHGITEQSSGLVYYGEAGGVNEAFSDIMGDTAEMFMYENDLLVGHYATKKGPYLREFECPENDNRSISHVSNMTEDLDPHLSSGVYRRIWYILVGEKGVPVQDAAEVFLHANSFYWHYMGTFYDCSCGLLKAAIDLGYDTEPYIVAFLDVGLDPCDPSTHIFSLSNNKTQSKITVSEEVRPVFRFFTPAWADRVLVLAQSESVSNASIHIKVYQFEEGQQLLNETQVLAESEGSVNVANSSGSVLIKLSSSDWVEYIDVRLTVGYTCLNDFNSTSFMDNVLYNGYCFGNFEP